MLKLYKVSSGEKLYWETWETDEGGHLVHFGTLGTKGHCKTLPTFPEAEIGSLLEQDYRQVPLEEHAVAITEYLIDGMGTEDDLEKRHRLQDRMDQTLGWTGLGHCDGGSIGMGTMEVCCFVIDFELAKTVISEDLEETEFADFHRIYNENESPASS